MSTQYIRHLYEAFEEGLSKPWLTIPESEALHDACLAVGVFTAPNSPSYERDMAMHVAGKNIATISTPEIVEYTTNIFKKCMQVRDGETVELSDKEKQFIKAGINKSFYKPFYE